jgi:hypothetical protein
MGRPNYFVPRNQRLPRLWAGELRRCREGLPPQPGRQANPVELKDDFLHQRRLRNDRFGCAP